MTKLKTTLAAFLLASTITMGQELSSFQNEAVRELYNRGILKNVIDEDDFAGKETFNRYEVATILYNTLKLDQGRSLEGVSQTEILILKSLVSELAFELGRLGAKDIELMRYIDRVEAKMDSRLSMELTRLEEKLDMITLRSEFNLLKDFRDGSQEERFKDIRLEGYVSALFDFNDFSDARLRYNFDKEEVDEIELNLNTELFQLTAFQSEDIKLPTFRSTLGIVNGQEIDSQDGIVINTKRGQADIQLLASSSEQGDIYGIEYVSKLAYFSNNEGQDSNYYVSWIEVEDNDETNRILALGGDFKFDMNENATQLFEIEYSKLRGREDREGGVNYSFPITRDEATYLYSRTDVLSPRYGKTVFSIGGINTGRWYDLSKAGNEKKNPFRETDLIKMEQNKYGSMANLYHRRSNWQFNINAAQYGSNESKNLSAERLATEVIYTIPAIAEFSLEFAMEKPELMLEEFNKEHSTNLDKLSKIKGELSINPRLRLNNVLNDRSENEFRTSFIQNKDLDKSAWNLYMDHSQEYTKHRSIKIAAKIEENYSWNLQDKDNFDKYQQLNLAANFERNFWLNEAGAMETSLVLGGRYSNKEFDTDKTKDERSYNVFAYIESNYDIWTFTYGGQFRHKYEHDKDSDKLKRLDQDKFTFGFEAEYKFNKDFSMIFNYGPVNIYESNNLIEDRTSAFDGEQDRTSAFDGEQDQISLRIKGRF